MLWKCLLQREFRLTFSEEVVRHMDVRYERPIALLFFFFFCYGFFFPFLVLVTTQVVGLLLRTVGETDRLRRQLQRTAHLLLRVRVRVHLRV